MQTQTLSPELSQALFGILQYQTPRIRNSDIYCILKKFIVDDADRGFGCYLCEVLPQVENIFKFVEKASRELEQGHYQLNLPQKRVGLDFQTLIDWIVSLCSPACIYQTAPSDDNQEEINLLIVIPLKENTTFKEMKKWLHTMNTNGWKVNYSLYQMPQLLKYIEAGSIFHMNACRKENLIYDSGTEPLPSIQPEDFQEAKRMAAEIFAQGFKRGTAFMDGAQVYRTKQENNIAAFMLHQATELTLHAVLQAVTGIYFREHSISDLLKYCGRLSPQLKDFFCNHPEDTLLLKLLQEAYVNARYNSEYKITTAELNLLYEKVTAILDSARRYVSETVAPDIDVAKSLSGNFSAG